MAVSNSLSKPILAVVLLGTVLLIAGCVTTKSGGFAERKDQSKAMETSLQLARTYISMGNWEQAKQHLQYVESVDKNNPETLAALALVFQNTGETETAEQYYQRSIDRAPRVMRTRNNYAAFLYDMERYREAAAQLEVVVEDLLYERRVEAFSNLGRCYVKLDKLPLAEQAFRRAYLMQRDEPNVLLALGDVNYRLGEYAEAQRYYEVHERLQSRPSAAALWLGIRLAEKFGDKNAYASNVLALKNLFPKSKEYLLYRAHQEQGNGADR